MYVIIVRDMIYISWLIRQTDFMVTIFYCTPTFGEVWYYWDCDTLIWAMDCFTPVSLRSQVIPQSIIVMHTNTLTLTSSQIRSTLSRIILSAVSEKRNYSTSTDWRFTSNNITKYWWIWGDYLMGDYHLHDGFEPSHHGSTSVCAPECPLMIHWTN